MIDGLLGEENREASRLIFRDTVRRVFAPGCKVDKCVVLVGPATIEKSKFMGELNGGAYPGAPEELVAELPVGNSFDAKFARAAAREFVKSRYHACSRMKVPYACAHAFTAHEPPQVDADVGRYFLVARVDGLPMGLDRDGLWAEAVERFGKEWVS